MPVPYRILLVGLPLSSVQDYTITVMQEIIVGWICQRSVLSMVETASYAVMLPHDAIEEQDGVNCAFFIVLCPY